VFDDRKLAEMLEEQQKADATLYASLRLDSLAVPGEAEALDLGDGTIESADPVAKLTVIVPAKDKAQAKMVIAAAVAKFGGTVIG
jgi:hypothetical protein